MVIKKYLEAQSHIHKFILDKRKRVVYNYIMKKILISMLVLGLTINMPMSNAITKNAKIKQNKSACSNIQKQYQFSVMKSWYDGKSTDEEFIQEIDNNIKLLSKYYYKTNGLIKKEIKVWQIEEENTKSSIVDADGTKLIKSIDGKINVFNNFNKLCTQIKTK